MSRTTNVSPLSQLYGTQFRICFADSYVIFETDNGVGKDWFNCNKWHDLDTLVSFIKSHE